MSDINKFSARNKCYDNKKIQKKATFISFSINKLFAENFPKI